MVSEGHVIPGWNADITPWQEYISPRIPAGGTYLEVGVFLGASLATLGKLRPDLNLIALDPWVADPSHGWMGPSEYQKIVDEHGGLYETFLYMMNTYAPEVLRRTRIVRATASTLREELPRVDLLFIDGAHDEASVWEDLQVFAPLVKPGGIIAGHDYCRTDYPGVPAAVDRFFGGRPNVGIPGVSGTPGWSCWWSVAP